MYFYSSNSKKIKKWTFIITLSFITAWFLYLYNYPSTNTFKTGLSDAIFYKGNSSSNQYALTFIVDDGTHMVPELLKILETQKINNATFFINAQWAKAHPSIVKKITKYGHEVGSYGYTKDSYKGLNQKEILADFKQADKVFKDLHLKNVTYLRPPAGYYNEIVLQAAAQRGLTLIDYSVDGKDSSASSYTSVIKNVVENIQGGDIIQLKGNNYSLQTKKALPQIIKQLKGKGLEQASISELISNTKAKSNIVN